MNEHNTLPEDHKEISSYEDFKRFFMHVFEKEEFRQPHYNKDNFLEGTYNLRVFWIVKGKGLGYGIADDWKDKRIVFYQFGSSDNWKSFSNGFAAQFKGDNS